MEDASKKFAPKNQIEIVPDLVKKIEQNLKNRTLDLRFFIDKSDFSDDGLPNHSILNRF